MASKIEQVRRRLRRIGTVRFLNWIEIFDVIGLLFLNGELSEGVSRGSPRRLRRVIVSLLLIVWRVLWWV